MAQTVTATVEAKIRGITVSPDGKSIGIAVDWVDASSKSTRSRACLTIASGEVRQYGQTKLGDAPPVASPLASQLASLAQGVVDALVASQALKF